MSYRWSRHRVFDEHGNDKDGLAAISLWWVARAAAEETLQGAPLLAAWLKLFASQLSVDDPYWLRWRGDLAESAELRRAYSGLYGRFVAKALLDQHLDLSRFISLRRYGIEIPGSAKVVRTSSGDIPDWIAWDDKNSRFVLGEAKGSLTSTDFMSSAGPKCVQLGKEQFDRVETYVSGRLVQPGRWVAATRWATDKRHKYPITVLWDPPVDHQPFSEEEARHHRAAMTLKWLNSLAAGFGFRGADELISPLREPESVVVRVQPGQVSPSAAWPPFESEADASAFIGEDAMRLDRRMARQRLGRDKEAVSRVFLDGLTESSLYEDRTRLDKAEPETEPHEGRYITALITRFGIRPLQTRFDMEELKRAQERARELEEPAMIIGLPLELDPASPIQATNWLDGAGMASSGQLSIFDLRSVEIETPPTKVLLP